MEIKAKMKVNLLLDSPGDIRSGYVNIDPFAPQNCTDGRFRGNVHDLSPLVDAGELDELIANDILDYFGAHEVDGILQNWLSRLAKGGTLTVSVVDAREVARSMLADSISWNDAQELLHGRQAAAWQARKTLFTLSQLASVLKNLGYKVLKRTVQNHRAIVTVQRVN